MPEQYNVETVIQYLKRQKEMHPDKHDVGIYKYLVGFVTEPSMQFLMKKKDVQNYYARHKIFALFLNHTVKVKLYKEKNAFDCYIKSCSRDRIIVDHNRKVRTLLFNVIESIELSDDNNSYKRPRGRKAKQTYKK